jgi:peptidoglycan hydrolase-like protein with peptidoglycan-binding domain
MGRNSRALSLPMRLIVCSLFSLSLLLGATAQPVAPKKKTPPSPTKTSSASKSKTAAAKTGTKPGATKTGTHKPLTRRASSKSPSSRNRARTPRYAVQNAPTPDRIREIQGALASRGYLKTAPSGAWDAETQDAMKRFQADRKLDQTGKLNALSLIGLGLGPKNDLSPELPK